MSWSGFRDTAVNVRRLVSAQQKVTHSSRRINSLFHLTGGGGTYLEVGVNQGQTFRDIHVPFRWGVDPEKKFSSRLIEDGALFTQLMSDEFFATLPKRINFDYIFVDGLHEWSQAFRDILNSLNRLNPGGVILVDDVLPDDEYSAMPDEAASRRIRYNLGIDAERWHGDVFKALIAVRLLFPALMIQCLGDPRKDNVQAFIWNPAGVPFVQENFPDWERRAQEIVQNINYKDIWLDARWTGLFTSKPEVDVVQSLARR